MAAPLNEAKVGEPCRDSGHVTGRSKSGRSRFSSCLRRSPSRYPLDARRPPGRALSFFHTFSTLPPQLSSLLLRYRLTRPMTRHQGDRQSKSRAGHLAIAFLPCPPPHPIYTCRASRALGLSTHSHLSLRVREHPSLRDVARCAHMPIVHVCGRPRLLKYVQPA